MLYIPSVLFLQMRNKTIGVYEIKIKWTIALVIAFVISALIRGLAWDTGTDWLVYYYFAVDAAKGYYNEWAQHTEITFQYFVKFLAGLNISDFSFFIFASAIIIYSVLRISSLYGKAQPYIIVFWYLLMFILSLNIYRQYVAMSFMMLAVWYLIHRKWKYAIILVVLSVLFHTSSIVAIPFFVLAYFLTKKNISVYVWIALIVATSIMTNTFLRAFLQLSSGFQNIFLMGNSNSYDVMEFADSAYGTTYIWILMIVNSIFIYFSDKIKNRYPHYAIFHYLTVITCILTPLCDQELLSRILLYAKMFMPITMGVSYYHYVRSKKLTNGKLAMYVVSTIYIILFYNYLIKLGETNPYMIKLDKIFI